MKSKRFLVTLLAVSVVVNLLMIGVLLGRMTGPGPEFRRVDPVMGMRRLVRELPDERATELAPAYRAYFAAVRPRFREIRGAQDDLRRAMLTDPLDEAAVRTSLSAFRQHLFNSQGTAHDAFVALAAELTLAEREQLVVLMGRRPPGAGHPPQPFPEGASKRPPGPRPPR